MHRVLCLLDPAKGTEVERCHALAPGGAQCGLTAGHLADGSHIFAYHLAPHGRRSVAWADRAGSE